MNTSDYVRLVNDAKQWKAFCVELMRPVRQALLNYAEAEHRLREHSKLIREMQARWNP